MELANENLNQVNFNIGSFSKVICETWNAPSTTLKDYILANVSIALVRSSEIKKDINKLYLLERNKYHEAIHNSSCSNHVIINSGTLEQAIEARKALGILLIAENDFNLRDNVIKLLRKYYPIVFNAVKKHDKKELIKRYLQMDEVTREIEGRIDASVYFYFGIYRSADIVDQGFFKSIINDANAFEFYHPITRDISKELETHKLEIQKIKILLRKEYGKINSYKDILNSAVLPIEELGGILENMFIINKLDINFLFSDLNFVNIDDVILSYIKKENKSSDPRVILETLVSGIFIKSLINDYKKCRDLYFQNNQETLLIKMDFLNEKLTKTNSDNQNLSTELISLKEENEAYENKLKIQMNKLNKANNYQVSELENKIKDLENQLLEETRYKAELSKLREFIFELNHNYMPSNSEKTLADCIATNKIIIIGGAKEWRRKFREKYPELRTLNGFNENFDTSILINYDYIFFFTGFMNHATYYRSMSYIRTHQIKFGYLGKTNMDLVEDELMDELEKLR